MNAPSEDLLGGPRKRRVSLLDMEDHPDSTVLPDDDEPTEQSQEDEADDNE